MPAPSITDILPGVAAALGVAGAPDPLGLAVDLAGVDRVVVVLVDGLGHHLLPELTADAPLLAQVVGGTTGRLRELACTFPSTTPTSLVSFGTGRAPGEHGVLGFVLNVPGTDRLLTHILWRDDPPPEQWAPRPTWFARLAQAGVAARAVLSAAFVGSGLTRSAYGGARFVGVATAAGYADTLADEIAAGPGLVFGYLADLDTAAHKAGVGSPSWRRAATTIDALLTRIATSLPARSALLVTADHGGLDVKERFDVDADPCLSAGVRLLAGEPRVRYVHTAPGAQADVLAAWREVLGARADVRGRDDAVAAGWFGPVRPEFLARIGDVVAVCTDAGSAVFASEREPKMVTELIGVHGGPTALETAIPLIVIDGPASGG